MAWAPALPCGGWVVSTLQRQGRCQPQSCASSYSVVLTSTCHHATIPEQPLTPKRERLSSQKGPWNSLVGQAHGQRWHGGREAGTGMCHSQTFLPMFLFAGIYAQFTPLELTGQGMGLVDICSRIPGSLAPKFFNKELPPSILAVGEGRRQSRGTVFFTWVPGSFWASPRASMHGQ